MNTFDHTNPRVKKAHQKHLFSNAPMLALLLIVFILLLFGGIALLYFGIPLGWALIGCSVLPVMLIFWIKTALATIPVGPSGSFTDLLSEDLLLLLSNTASSADLVQILPKTKSGIFIMARFGLPLPFFAEIAPFLPDTSTIYTHAIDICKSTNSEEITGAILAVAMVYSLPNYELLLRQMQLTIDDLRQGIIWHNYLTGMVKDIKKPVRSGGIARDFAFGYTPTLQHFAINLSERYLGAHTRLHQADHTKVIQQIIDTFTQGGRQNVALVGPYGSGRSTIVNVLAETLMDADSGVPRSLKYRQIFSLDAPSLISAAKSEAELQQLMIRIFNEIYSAKNIILCLDNAHLFFENGPGSVDIANILMPMLESGNIRTILIMDDQKFLEISAKDPALANLLNKIVIAPSNREDTIKILMDQVPFLEHQKNVLYTYLALTESYRLSEQYVHDIEMPGKAKLLLESAASYAENNVVTALSVQTAVEKSYGVKVKVATDEEDRTKLLNLESLIHERMIDQTEAVSAVANALRRAGAGVKHSGRPIGTFLFLGPTGVGKTELAKSLSEVYFSGEDNIIRLDMNEFVSATDVSRLIKDGAEDELSLTAQVSKQPFSVILLDEIEKAHPSVLTTLLQVLDEGILRDEKNREISFRDSIIIATSNAGANTIREKIISGAKIDDFKDAFIEELIASNEFKPEFLNRFDEICLFKPLSKEDLVGVLDLIIASTNKTLEPQKITVEVDDAAKQILIDKGYDPKMGARPMRRIVQKTVENIVAAAILSGQVTPGTTLHITPQDLAAL